VISVTRTFHWAMGHRLQRHDGLCRFPHGHNYQADVTVVGALRTAGPASGMVLDFSVLDALVRAVIDPWDHAFMVETGDPLVGALLSVPETTRLVVVQAAPTAENIAMDLAAGVAAIMPRGLRVSEVRVHEGPKAVATWRDEP
jgi:6-pyruvoyltetrahydropterin/6-carboxytetrahydropterin synthase